jgi:hypothetical protein
MYFAGLSHNQGLESIAWLCSVGGLTYQLYKSKLGADIASANGGGLKVSNVPIRARVATIVHASAFLVPLCGYIATTALNRFDQPDWLIDFALPDENISIRDKSLARTVGAFAFVGLSKLYGIAFDHLGSQWAAIGVCLNPRFRNIITYCNTASRETPHCAVWSFPLRSSSIV